MTCVTLQICILTGTHVCIGLVSKTTSLRINMSCVSCFLQASPHKYDFTTLPIDTYIYEPI